MRIETKIKRLVKLKEEILKESKKWKGTCCPLKMCDDSKISYGHGHRNLSQLLDGLGCYGWNCPFCGEDFRSKMTHIKKFLKKLEEQPANVYHAAQVDKLLQQLLSAIEKDLDYIFKNKLKDLQASFDNIKKRMDTGKKVFSKERKALFKIKTELRAIERFYMKSIKGRLLKDAQEVRKFVRR